MRRADVLLAEQARRAQETARSVGDALAGAGRSGGASRVADSHVKAFQQVEREAKRAASEVDRINRQTARNAEQNDRLLERSARQLAQVRAREAKRSADDFIRELNRMKQAERQTGGGTDSSGLLSAVSGGRLAGGGAVAAIGATTAAFALAAKTGVEYRETIERLSKSFQTLLGSSSAAQAHLKELEQFANRTPFEFEEVAAASQKFLNMGINAQEVVPILTAVGNAVARTGGGSQQVEAVARAIAQVGARGKVSAEEMNQMADALVDGWGPLEKELGKTKAEVMEMAKAGEISADTFIRAFRKAHEGGSAMADQMNTLTGSTSTLTDAAKQLLSKAYTPLHGMLRDVAVEGAKVTTEGWKTERAFTALANASENFLDNFLPARMAGIADNLRLIRSLLPGGGQAPPANWGAMDGPWGEGATINVPKEFQYKPKIPDEDLAATQAAELRRQKEAYLADGIRARKEAERDAEEAMRKARAEAERQAGTVGNLRERLRDLTIEVEHFGQRQVEQEVALMRARTASEDLTGEYRKQADALANLTAFQMRALDVKRELKEAQDEAARQNETDIAFYRQATDLLNELNGRERTHIEQTQLFILEGLRQGTVLDKLTEQWLLIAAANRDATKSLADFVAESGRLHTVDFKVGDGPWVDPSTVGPAPANIYEEQIRRQEQMREIAYDVADIWGVTFDGIRTGWERMWDSLEDIAFDTARRISQELLVSFITGQRSEAGGIIGLAANRLSGVFNRPAVAPPAGGAGSAAGALIGGMGFASGGSFIVGGSGGVDRTPVGFWATKGERVTVETPAQQRGGETRIFIVDERSKALERAYNSDRHYILRSHRMRKTGRTVR